MEAPVCLSVRDGPSPALYGLTAAAAPVAMDTVADVSATGRSESPLGWMWSSTDPLYPSRELPLPLSRSGLTAGLKWPGTRPVTWPRHRESNR